MFEQSILAENGTNKGWSFLASLSAELIVISLMILIPLLYGDHLPGFHWKTITVGPPIRSMPHQPVQRDIAGQSTPSPFAHASRIYNPMQRPQPGQPVTSGPPVDSPPGFIAVAGGDSFGPPSVLPFDTPVVIKPPSSPPTRPNAPPSKPIPVSGGVQMAKLIRQVVPIYPQMAKIAHVSGVVHLVGIIAKDGTIRNLQIVDGHPMLTKAALDAVSQWVYKPTLLSGEPVEVICPIDVVFRLSQ